MVTGQARAEDILVGDEIMCRAGYDLLRWELVTGAMRRHDGVTITTEKTIVVARYGDLFSFRDKR